MKTVSRHSSIPAAMALNMLALISATPFLKKQPQDFLLKRIFRLYQEASDHSNIEKIDASFAPPHDLHWFGNYE